jgi:hypothetical protein
MPGFRTHDEANHRISSLLSPGLGISYRGPSCAPPGYLRPTYFQHLFSARYFPLDLLPLPFSQVRALARMCVSTTPFFTPLTPASLPTCRFVGAITSVCTAGSCGSSRNDQSSKNLPLATWRVMSGLVGLVKLVNRPVGARLRIWSAAIPSIYFSDRALRSKFSSESFSIILSPLNLPLDLLPHLQLFIYPPSVILYAELQLL